MSILHPDNQADLSPTPAAPLGGGASPTGVADAPAAGLTQLRTYVDLLAGEEPAGALLEVRTRRPDRLSMRQWFVDVGSRARLLELLPKIALRADVYLGAAPRRARLGSRQAVTHAHVAWVDVDGPDGAARLAGFMAPPTLIVASGSPGGVHAYWRLSPAADVATLEQLNRRLAAALGGDPVWAATTILRPPATLNHKHDPPRPVGVVGAGPAVYEAEALSSSLAAITPDIPAARHTSRRATRRDERDPLLAIAPTVYVERLLGVRVPRGGFISCPWHEDSRPSFKVYGTPAGGWYCYGRCRAGGSIYDLAARLLRLGTRGRDFQVLRARLLDRFPEARS